MRLQDIALGLGLIGAAILFLGQQESLSLPGGSSLFSAGTHKPGASPQAGAADPAALMKTDLYGPALRTPAVLLPGRTPALLDSLAEETPAPGPRGIPERTILHDPAPQCGFRRPGPDEYIANVFIHDGGIPSVIRAYSEARLIETVLRALRFQKENPGRPLEQRFSAAPAPRPLEVVEVLVSHPGKPVYLILQSRNAGVLWNIRPLPGTRVSHVAVISPLASGVANLPEGSGLEILNTSARPGCGLRPEERPNEGWGVLERFTAQGNDYPEKFDRWFERYDAWFRATFGVPADHNQVAAARAAHVLAGQPPDTSAPAGKAPPAPLAGAVVHLSRTEHVDITVNAAEWERIYRQKFDALLTAALGGEVELIRPPVQTRAGKAEGEAAR